MWKDVWNLDLIKIYFTTTFTEAIKGAHNTGRSQEEKMKDMSDYMICRHEFWEPGQSYETSLKPTANYHAFDCEFNTILNPEVSLDRVKAHVSHLLNQELRNEWIKLNPKWLFSIFSHFRCVHGETVETM